MRNVVTYNDQLERLPNRSIVTWTTLTTRYASYDDKSNVMYLLEKMEGECVEGDGVILLSILTTHAHIGIVDEGLILKASTLCNVNSYPILKVNGGLQLLAKSLKECMFTHKVDR